MKSGAGRDLGNLYRSRAAEAAGRQPRRPESPIPPGGARSQPQGPDQPQDVPTASPDPGSAAPGGADPSPANSICAPPWWGIPFGFMADSPTPSSKKRSCLVPLLLGCIVVLLVGIGLHLWSNRPIKPVALSTQEQAVVAEKIEAIQGEGEPTYEKGTRDIILTERELNGLLHQHTTLGDKLSFQLGTDAIHARLETDLDPDVPLLGGRRLKARARFFVKTENGTPSLVLDDLTVWGVSAPNDWLGQLKGRDLLAELLGSGQGGSISGVEDLAIEPGRVRITLKE